MMSKPRRNIIIAWVAGARVFAISPITCKTAGADPGFFQTGGCKYESKTFTIWNPGSRRFKVTIS